MKTRKLERGKIRIEAMKTRKLQRHRKSFYWCESEMINIPRRKGRQLAIENSSNQTHLRAISHRIPAYEEILTFEENEEVVEKIFYVFNVVSGFLHRVLPDMYRTPTIYRRD